jgi:hypothetical protein
MPAHRYCRLLGHRYAVASLCNDIGLGMWMYGLVNPGLGI